MQRSLMLPIMSQSFRQVRGLGMRNSSIFNPQHVATRCNRVANMLRSVLLAIAGPTMLGYVALRCCYRLAGALALLLTESNKF